MSTTPTLILVSRAHEVGRRRTDNRPKPVWAFRSLFTTCSRSSADGPLAVPPFVCGAALWKAKTRPTYPRPQIVYFCGKNAEYAIYLHALPVVASARARQGRIFYLFALGRGLESVMFDCIELSLLTRRSGRQYCLSHGCSTVVLICITCPAITVGTVILWARLFYGCSYVSPVRQ